MYAIIKTGGKQYRVTVGDVVQIEKLPQQIGEQVQFDNVMFIADGDQYNAGQSVGHVVATVVGEGQGKKVTNFDYRNKHRRRVTHGHRQLFSRVEIKEIVAG